MSKRLNVLIIFIFGLFILIFSITRSSLKETKKATSPQRRVILGAWTQGLFDPHDKTLHPEKLLEFEKLIGKKVSVAHYYEGWEMLDNPSLSAQFQTLQSNGWEPMLNVNPYYFNECPPQNIPVYSAIAQGKCDDFLHKAGKNIRGIKKPFYLVFAWEMNNKANEWSVPYTGSTPQDFVAAWRHIHDIFKEEKADNAVWVFCPNVPDVKDASYSELYPGDNYVDWIGLDGYNWGATQSWSQWVSFSGVFTSSYKQITSIAPKKPLMIAEVNTTDKGGDKASWYKDMLENQIPNNFPKIKALVIFNEDKTKVEGVDWRVNVTSGSLKSFKNAIRSPLYK